MQKAGQKIIVVVCILAGVGLAVLIGLTHPPGPQQLAVRAAETLGLFSEPLPPSAPQADPQGERSFGEGKTACASSAGKAGSPAEESPGPTAGQGEPFGGQTAPVPAPPDALRAAAGPLQTTVHAPAPSADPPKSSPSGSQSSRPAGSSDAWQMPDRSVHEPKPPLGEVWAPAFPAYAQQVSGGSAEPAPEGQTRPAGGARAPTESASSLSAKEAPEEIPRQLLELWRRMRSGGQIPAGSGGLSSQGGESAPPAEGSETGTLSSATQTAEGGSGTPTGAEHPSQHLSSSEGLSSSEAEAAANRPAKVRRLSEPGVQGTSTAGSSQRSSASGSTAQLQQEANGRLIINIRNEDIRKVLEMLSEHGNLNILTTSSVQGKVSASLTGVDLDSALQAILRSAGYVARREGKFIYVGTPEDFLRMEQAADRIGTRVYRPNYVKASDLKDLIQPLLTEKVGLVSVSAPAEIGISSDDDKAGGNNFAGTETVLVRDYESVLAQIDQVVAEIDVRPLQVHIQAMILSVRLDDTDKFGVDFKKLINNSNFTIGWGTPVDSLSKVTFTQGGLKFGFIDGDVGAFLEALETVADANVIAAPRLMVLNKHRADILIGRQEGYVNTTQTETATTQSVQFLDIGTQLRIRPFISPDGLIRMEIHPELSDGTVTVQGNFTLPQKDVTKVTTNIMVRDGCTVVIGGLMQEQATSSVNQIPFFGNLPLVGVLFRRKTEEIKRVEIIVLVTPHIVREPEAYGEAALQQCEFQRRHNVYLEKMSPLGKRSVARRYVRMAQQACNEGDMDRALRFAEMAVHFDPLNQDALEIRAQIWQRISAAPLPEQALPSGRNWTAPLDGPTVAPWILQELEKPLPEAPSPESPLPEIPPPPEPGKENPRSNPSGKPTGNPSGKPPGTPPAKPIGSPPSPLGSGRIEQIEAPPEAGQQNGLSPRPHPPAPESRSKPIRRPSLFQSEPIRFP